MLMKLSESCLGALDFLSAGYPSTDDSSVNYFSQQWQHGLWHQQAEPLWNALSDFELKKNLAAALTATQHVFSEVAFPKARGVDTDWITVEPCNAEKSGFTEKDWMLGSFQSGSTVDIHPLKPQKPIEGYVHPTSRSQSTPMTSSADVVNTLMRSISTSSNDMYTPTVLQGCESPSAMRIMRIQAPAACSARIPAPKIRHFPVTEHPLLHSASSNTIHSPSCSTQVCVPSHQPEFHVNNAEMSLRTSHTDPSVVHESNTDDDLPHPHPCQNLNSFSSDVSLKCSECPSFQTFMDSSSNNTILRESSPAKQYHAVSPEALSNASTDTSRNGGRPKCLFGFLRTFHSVFPDVTLRKSSRAVERNPSEIHPYFSPEEGYTPTALHKRPSVLFYSYTTRHSNVARHTTTQPINDPEPDGRDSQNKNKVNTLTNCLHQPNNHDADQSRTQNYHHWQGYSEEYTPAHTHTMASLCPFELLCDALQEEVHGSSSTLSSGTPFVHQQAITDESTRDCHSSVTLSRCILSAVHHSSSTRSLQSFDSSSSLSDTTSSYSHSS